MGSNFGRGFDFHEHPDCVVEAVSDVRPERRAALMKTYRCAKPYESLEKLIFDRDVDAVAIFTPAPDHVRHVVAILKSGKHALSAVPAATPLDECALLLELRPDGLVRITLKKAHADGTIAVDMDPLSMLCRLAASVPPPRRHTIR